MFNAGRVAIRSAGTKCEAHERRPRLARGLVMLSKARRGVDGPSTPPSPREARRSPLQDGSRCPGQSWPTTRAAAARVRPQSAALLPTHEQHHNHTMNHTKTNLSLGSKSRRLGIRHLRPRPFIKGINGGIQNLQLGRRRQPEPGLDLDKPARKQRLRSDGFDVVVDEDLRIEVQAPFNFGCVVVCVTCCSLNTVKGIARRSCPSLG